MLTLNPVGPVLLSTYCARQLWSLGLAMLDDAVFSDTICAASRDTMNDPSGILFCQPYGAQWAAAVNLQELGAKC